MRKSFDCACVLVVSLIMATMVGRTAFALEETTGLVFKIPDLTVYADSIHPTQGTISAQLNLTGVSAANPPLLASYNVAFDVTGHPAGFAFAAPQDPSANKLFASGNLYTGATQLPYTIRFAKDATVPSTAIDGGLLVTVPFTVAAGINSGTFPINFIPGNELANPNAAVLPMVLLGGSITVLPAQAGLVGDYNGNGVVDAADYAVWRETLGQAGSGLAADGNGNGTIDTGDYSVWRANFGQTAASGAGFSLKAIPEPSTIALLALSVLVLAARARW